MARKSLANQVLDSQQIFGDNDDEAESFALRSDAVMSPPKVSTTSSDRRHSLGLSYLQKIPEPQMKEHILHCIKLNTENKINVKNAFSLEMIDFMSFAFMKKQSEITDLQEASVALDVCTKIYAYRVDGLHTEVLKMAGGLGKRDKVVETTSDAQELCENEEEDGKKQSESQMKTKRKKIKSKVISTEDALKGCIETSYPSQSIIGTGDLCTSDMLYQVVLPNHVSSGFYYHSYNDIILDVVDDIKAKEKKSSKYTISAIEDCSNLDICSSFSDFKLLNWSYKDEPQDIEPTQENNTKRFQFDLDASLLSAEEYISEPMNYFNIEEDENNINLCAKNPEPVQNIVDLRDIVAKQVSEPSEYSFIQKNLIHWAGPSFWKIKTFGKVLSNSKVIETCGQVALNRKKEIVLEYNDDIMSTIEQEFSSDPAGKIQFKTTPKSWSGLNKTLPEDVHYDVSQLHKLYHYPSVIMNDNENGNQLSATHLPDDGNYNYNNENDISDYCPNIDPDNEEIQERNDCEELRRENNNTVEAQMAFTGDNLVVAPKLTQQNFLQYSQRAKKIDMRRLKQAVWKSLTSPCNEEKEDIRKEVELEGREKVKASKPFNEVYKSLPNMLSKTNVEALSVPIAFVSLLHLANEKSLNLSSLPDLSDIIVEKN